MFTLSKGAAKLREQMNVKFPKRDTRSDGWRASRAHSRINPRSDHEPDRNGIVHAIDLDADFGHPAAGSAGVLADQLRDYARSGKKGSDRVKYVIYNRRICSARDDWAWRPYTGANPHTSHIHISVTDASDTDGSLWPLPILRG